MFQWMDTMWLSVQIRGCSLSVSNSLQMFCDRFQDCVSLSSQSWNRSSGFFLQERRMFFDVLFMTSPANQPHKRTTKQPTHGHVLIGVKIDYRCDTVSQDLHSLITNKYIKKESRHWLLCCTLHRPLLHCFLFASRAQSILRLHLRLLCHFKLGCAPPRAWTRHNAHRGTKMTRILLQNLKSPAFLPLASHLLQENQAPQQTVLTVRILKLSALEPKDSNCSIPAKYAKLVTLIKFREWVSGICIIWYMIYDCASSDGKPKPAWLMANLKKKLTDSLLFRLFEKHIAMAL